jgi:hypothetical protein
LGRDLLEHVPVSQDQSSAIAKQVPANHGLTGTSMRPTDVITLRISG